MPYCSNCNIQWTGSNINHCAQCGRPISDGGGAALLGCLLGLGLLGVAGERACNGGGNNPQPPVQQETKAIVKPNVPPNSGENPKQKTPDRTPPKVVEPPTATTGDLVLKTKSPIVAGAQAWVEINGSRKADWKVGTTEVQLTLPSGKHRVRVRSTYQNVTRDVYDKQVEISAGTTTTVNVGPS